MICALLAAQGLNAAFAQGFLNVSVIEGEGAFNDIKRGIGHAPAVVVKNEDDNPVKGATVKFTLPLIGPGGAFPGGGATYTATSDEQGIARSIGFKPNTEEGRFNIKVAAEYLGKTGSIVIPQSNTLAGGGAIGKGGGGHGKTVAIVVAVAGAAAAGAILGLRGHSSSGSSGASASPTVLSAGTVTVGGPR